MTAEEKTLEITVTELRLSEGDDLEGLFPPVYERLKLWADVVTVEGLVRLPGRSLEIRPR